MPFKKGKDPNRAKGGAREGAGRSPDWLKAKCQKIIDKDKLVEFLRDVAKGKNMEQVVTDEGVSIAVPAAIRERLKATEMLLDRGFGKAAQHVELGAGEGVDIVAFMRQSEQERGL